MAQQIIVTIDAEGNPKIEAVGFTGPGCKLATAQLEVALGAPVERHLKPEFHAPAQQITNKIGPR